MVQSHALMNTDIKPQVPQVARKFAPYAFGSQSSDYEFVF